MNPLISDDDYAVDTDVPLGPPVYNEMGKPYLIVSLDGKRIGLSGVTGSYVAGKYCRDPTIDREGRIQIAARGGVARLDPKPLPQREPSRASECE